MNGHKEACLLFTLVMLTGCTPRIIYLQDDYTGFIQALDTTPGFTIGLAGNRYRIVRPAREALAAQNMLLSLRIPDASFENTRIHDALAVLDRIQKESNQGVAIPIVFKELPGETYKVKPLTFRIHDATLIEVLNVICAETHLTLGMTGSCAVLFYGEDFFRDRALAPGTADNDIRTPDADLHFTMPTNSVTNEGRSQ